MPCSPCSPKPMDFCVPIVEAIIYIYMYVYIYIYIYIYMYVYIYVYIYIRIYIYLFIDLLLYQLIYLFLYLFMFIFLFHILIILTSVLELHETSQPCWYRWRGSLPRASWLRPSWSTAWARQSRSASGRLGGVLDTCGKHRIIRGFAKIWRLNKDKYTV